jgi:hypothetical protein
MKGKPEKRAVEGAARKTRADKDALANPHAFVVRIPDQEAMKRAIMAWLEVPAVYHCFPDNKLLIGREHLEVLKREGIPFEALS